MKRNEKTSDRSNKLVLNKQAIRELKPADLEEGAGAALARRLPETEPC